MIEMGDFFPKMKVLQQCRTSFSSLKRIFVVGGLYALVRGNNLVAVAGPIFFELLILAVALNPVAITSTYSCFHLISPPPFSLSGRPIPDCGDNYGKPEY
jgi:hypothetical protein